mmetsp:Transcript_781/g.2759  ORF Transcript_781/g.2759 Transcript_781/m.2759 type:complete len:237 (-) Transcript_781:830-1540(-)
MSEYERRSPVCVSALLRGARCLRGAGAPRPPRAPPADRQIRHIRKTGDTFYHYLPISRPVPGAPRVIAAHPPKTAIYPAETTYASFSPLVLSGPCRASAAFRALVSLRRSGPPQVGVDEASELAVEHGLHLRSLVARARVLDHLVRREDVRPDLLPPLGRDRLPPDLRELVHPLRLHRLEHPRLDHRDCNLAVPRLRPLLLAPHHQPRRKVPHPHRRLNLVDVLAARASRSHRRHL